MRRENGIRKGLNRLLVLVLAAAITMAFSFTGVFADDTGGDRPKTPQPGTITNIGIAYIAFADIHSLLKEFF